MSTKIRIPHAEYVQALYLIRDMPNLEDRRVKLLNASPSPPDGMPKGMGSKGDPTGERAVLLAETEDKIWAVKSSLEIIPEEYRRAVYEWCSRERTSPTWVIEHFAVHCSVSTLSRYRVQYIQEVARRARITV